MGLSSFNRARRLAAEKEIAAELPPGGSHIIVSDEQIDVEPESENIIVESGDEEFDFSDELEQEPEPEPETRKRKK